MKLENILQPALILALLVGELYVIYDIYKKDKIDNDRAKKDYLDNLRKGL
jgi:hypothetical protein